MHEELHKHASRTLKWCHVFNSSFSHRCTEELRVAGVISQVSKTSSTVHFGNTGVNRYHSALAKYLPVYPEPKLLRLIYITLKVIICCKTPAVCVHLTSVQQLLERIASISVLPHLLQNKFNPAMHWTPDFINTEKTHANKDTEANNIQMYIPIVETHSPNMSEQICFALVAKCAKEVSTA